jgi:hypothetical protein
MEKKDRHLPIKKPLESQVECFIAHLLNTGGIKDYIRMCGQQEKVRVIVFLYSIYSAKKISELTGYAPIWIWKLVQRNRDLLDEAVQRRNETIANMAERKALEAIEKIDIDQIPDEKKAKTVRDLMESSRIAGDRIGARSEGGNDDMMELVFRVKKRIGGNAPRSDSNEDPIDITESVTLNNEQ